MADFKQYDPGLIAISFSGVQILGFMDGTFVTCERAEDAFALAVGAGGDTTRVRSRNRSGTVTVTLKAESPTNDTLSAIAKSDELFGDGVGTLMVKNINGTTIVEAESAWIKKLPNVEYGDAASGREWMFDCAELIMLVGGAVV